MAHVNTFLTVACTPRRAKRSMRDAVPDACSRWVRSNGCGHLRLSCSERDRTAARTCATPRLHAAASLALRMEEATERGRCPARLRPAGRARFLIRRAQYKCGQSGVRNNHPLGKTGYVWRLLLCIRFIAFVGARGCRHRPFEWRSNACSFRDRWVQQDGGHACDGAAAGASVSNCGPESMTPICGNQAMLQAGTTGAEVA